MKSRANGREPEGPEREFVGYGRNAPRVVWPNDAKVALSLVVNYEAGAEYSIAAGDRRRDSVGEFATPINPTAPSIRDLCTESTFEYESRAGVWRLARILDEFELKVTFHVCGQALVLNPAVGEYIKTADHEPCAHGWRWEELWRLTDEDERHHLRLCVEAIREHCGTRPLGWFSRCTPSVRTRRLIVDEGGFVYDGDAYNDDLPYFVEVNGHRHLVLPYSFAFNDMRFAFPGYSDPMSFYTYLTMALDDLREEGNTRPKMMSVGLHPRWVGQPGRARALRNFIEYALGTGEVWFARRVDVANWWIENHEQF